MLRSQSLIAGPQAAFGKDGQRWNPGTATFDRYEADRVGSMSGRYALIAIKGSRIEDLA